ncbi:hypothetical protein EQG79_02845 [Spirosoma sordidisoli]|uniref:Uncharacterized protein n=2 Tax=Spirosoma sordidisoli TaxID=2502893 RepID=A0A4Q2UYJ3_9BACT|nr:hypothetical protein EQG79_02845 [Spirosoma sordidisoli]
MSVLALVSCLTMSCQDNNSTINPAPTTGVLINDAFATSQNGWDGDVSDYAVEQQSLIEFSFSHAGLPAPLDQSQKALRVFGRNRSDDIFMFVRKQLTGLRPNTDYKLQFDVELASRYPANSIGIGGSPGSSVFLKAGASATKPEKVLDGTFYKLSVDKGSQSDAGPAAVLIGNVANGKDVEEYTLIQRTNKEQPLTARTNDKGELWVFVGSDSGFEGDQALYYSKIKVTAL